MSTDEQIAHAFHDAYERLAPAHGYETREASAKPWQDVPAANRALMVATVGALLEQGVISASPPDLSDLLEGRHPSTVAVAKHFRYSHLPPHLQAVSKPCAQLAAALLEQFPDGPELTFGLRQLLLAKDAFVRTALG